VGFGLLKAEDIDIGVSSPAGQIFLQGGTNAVNGVGYSAHVLFFGLLSYSSVGRVGGAPQGALSV
jgi:hypothetical protein